MIEKIKQYKNLILLVMAVFFLIVLIAADPLIKPAAEGYTRYFLPLSHFAISGSAAAQQ